MCAEYNVPFAGIVPADEDVVDADRAGILLGEGRGGAVHEAVDR